MLFRLLLAAAVAIFVVLWVRFALDVFRRPDLTRAAKCAWAIIMLVVPFLGILFYMMIRPTDAQVARRATR